MKINPLTHSNVWRAVLLPPLLRALLVCPLHLIALALAAFGIGTGEYVMIGLLPNVAADFDVSIDVAGLLISAYAIGVAVGAPVMAILTSKLPRKTTLIGLVCTFTVGNLLCALAPSYGSLILARIVTAFCNGAFLGLGAVVAADLASSERRSSAIALMLSGMTVANIVGVPLGTALGQFSSWRSVFWGVSLIGLLAVAALGIWLPRHIPMRKAKLLHEFRVLADVRVLWPLLASVLVSAASFSVLAYFSPLLQTITGITEHWVTLFLLIFGIALTVGSTLGGGQTGRPEPGSVIALGVFFLGADVSKYE